MIREYDEKYLMEMYQLLFSHRKITGTLIEDLKQKPTFEEFCVRFPPAVKTFLYFKDDELISFMCSRELGEFPSWYVSMVTAKPQKVFNPKTNGLSELFNATFGYWNTTELSSFFVIQPKTHAFIMNPIVLEDVPEAKVYDLPSVIITTIPKGERCKYSIIDKMLKHNTYNEDMVVKWGHKKVNYVP